MKLWYAVALSMTMAVAASGPTVQDLETRLSRAKAEMASGNWAQAESMLQAIIEDDENYAPAFFELSVVFLERDNLKGAQENITKAIEKDPRNDEFRSEAERIAALSGGMSRARRAYDERDFDSAILEYEKVVSEFPRFASAHFGLGLALTKAGSPRPAADAFRQASGLNPDSESYTKALYRLVAEEYNKGNRLYNARDWEAALASYQQAIDLDPTFHKAYYRLAKCYKNMGDTDEALKTLDQVLKVKPDYITAIVEKGNIFRTAAQSDQAEAAYRQALSYDSQADKAWIGLGAVLSSGRPKEAEEAFRAAIAANPKSSTAHEYLGELYSDQERWEDALAPLEKASDLKRRDHRTAWRLAAAYNALGRHAEAQQAAKRSTDLKRNFEYAWFEKGIAEKALGNRQAALEAFRNAGKGRDAAIRKSARYELDQLSGSH